MVGAEFSWSSSDESVATVDASGRVTGVAEGSVTITASTDGVSGSAEISVFVPAGPVSVGVSPWSGSVAVGATLSLSAEAYDANGRPVADAEFSWSSSDESVATVDAEGLVTGVAEGTATITATTDGVSGSAEISVFVPDVPVSVRVSPSSGSVTVGGTLSLSAQAYDANGRVVAGAQFSWSSSNQSVATVDASGRVTGVAEGTATVTASTGGVSGLATVSVSAPAVPVSVTVSPSTGSVAVGATLNLSAQAFDANGRVVAGVQFSWSSSDQSVATVDASGLVTGVAAGSATITASTGGVSGSAAVTVTNPGNSADRAILIALYNATDGPNWVDNTNWLSDARLEDWYGVNTDDQGRVTVIGLSNNGLRGGIPEGLGGLANLTQLDLGSNDLTGPIPPELANLTNLTYLILSFNELSGSVPTRLGDLAKLTYLWVGGNDLTGRIPPDLADLANLTHLYLGSNELTGPIPPELADLANLTFLDLKENSLTGPIPPELGNLSNLEWLSLVSNGLTGPIPSELGDLASLTDLDLGSNDLTGSIPPELGNLTNLTSLLVYETDLTGPVPPELTDLTNLTALIIHGNDLTGRLPGNLPRLPLEHFWWKDNAGLCAPDTSAFRTWLAGIGDHGPGPFCSGSAGRGPTTTPGPGEVGPTGAIPDRSP